MIAATSTWVTTAVDVGGPVVVGLVGFSIRTLITISRNTEHLTEIDRRLDRLDRHVNHLEEP